MDVRASPCSLCAGAHGCCARRARLCKGAGPVAAAPVRHRVCLALGRAPAVSARRPFPVWQQARRDSWRRHDRLAFKQRRRICACTLDLAFLMPGCSSPDNGKSWCSNPLVTVPVFIRQMRWQVTEAHLVLVDSFMAVVFRVCERLRLLLNAFSVSAQAFLKALTPERVLGTDEVFSTAWRMGT